MPLTTNVPTRGFPDTEYIDRTTKAQALMAKDDLAGLLLMSEEDVRYFTGFHTLFWPVSYTHLTLPTTPYV